MRIVDLETKAYANASRLKGEALRQNRTGDRPVSRAGNPPAESERTRSRLEEEVKTLRQISEKMAFSGKLPSGQSPGMSLDSRPLSPPPDAPGKAGSHGLASVSGEPPSALSSPSDDDY